MPVPTREALSHGVGFPWRSTMGKSTLPGDDQDQCPPGGEVSVLFRAWGDGDRAALDRLIPIVYDEVSAHAADSVLKLRTSPTGTLRSTCFPSDC